MTLRRFVEYSGLGGVLWKKRSRDKGVKILLRNHIRMQCRLSGFFSVWWDQQQVFARGSGEEEKEPEGMKGGELKLENPSDGSTHHSASTRCRTGELCGHPWPCTWNITLFTA